MSHPTAHPITSSSNFQPIINNALDKYKKRTKIDLLAHSLAVRLQSCSHPSDILDVLQQQLLVLGRPQSTDKRWIRWLESTVNIICALSSTLTTGVSLVFSPANTIFTGVGVLLSAVKHARASDHDALISIFDRIKILFGRLEIHIELPLTVEMMDIIAQILAESLSILGIATKEIKRGRLIKYMKKLIERPEIEDGLERLDKLTQEARMVAAQTLMLAHMMTRFDVQVADLLLNGHKWLSPPDPSTNHNIACGTHHKKTATWFFQGNIFREWKSTGSLLWIHGKPGSGKSVFCSMVIQDIEAMCKLEQASMAYFYFDYQDANKQDLRDLVPSLLTQLSTQSRPRCEILSNLYSTHDEGKNLPSDDILVEYLKHMLTLPDQRPTYLIIDALDESPNTSGIRSPRERILRLLEELVELCLPHLRICVTSRPEVDIRDVLEPLTSEQVSLHDQSGQMQDIVDYIKSVVYSNSEATMRRWSTQDKEFVIEVLSERADGMFLWVSCQLEALRCCLSPSIRRTLDEVPESLDETYGRVLKEIKRPNRDHALRLLQCLVVAVRPLLVQELAEVLAVDFDDAEGIPRLKPDWRWEDEEQIILTLCSSLITTVESDGFRVVRFSHSSVKDFLTSARLATSSGDISCYYIDFEPAHTILAQACISVLLRADDRVEENDIGKSSPLSGYAAQHWVTHAQFERVSSFIGKAMEYLFDPDKPYLAAWVQLHDIDTHPLMRSSFHEWLTASTKPGVTPLYYATLCGFEDLAEHLVVDYPGHLNTSSGYYGSPLVAALARGHLRTVKFLRDNGASVNVQGNNGETPLHSATWYGDLETVQLLLEHGADLTARLDRGSTPLHVAVERGWVEVLRMLLEHGGNVDAEDNEGTTPLHIAARGNVKIIRMLLERGANVGAKDCLGRTPLHGAAQHGSIEIARMLFEHGADVNARSNHYL